MKCEKKMYSSEQDATEAAHEVKRRRPSGWPFTVYRCGECRFPGGARAWHWGNQRVRVPRRKR